MEPGLLAYQSGTLTITLECSESLFEAITESYSYLDDSVQFILFTLLHENLFILKNWNIMKVQIVKLLLLLLVWHYEMRQSWKGILHKSVEVFANNTNFMAYYKIVIRGF